MMHSIFLGEFLGTMTLIYLGNGVVANVLLEKTKGNGGGLIVITAGWAFAVTMGIFVATFFGSTGANLNPAVTISNAVRSGELGDSFMMIIAQMLGAIAGATLVWLQYKDHYAATEDKGLKLATFSTGPAIKNTAQNFLSEFLGTFMMGLMGATLGSIQNGLGPFAVGLMIWAIGLSLGGPTGYAINPARDLGPRIAHAILPIAGKGGSDWGYAWIPVLGPICGAIAGGLIAGMVAA
jgi:glycerol uptake facilitator protein